MPFHREWVPANGRSGGILLGVNTEMFEVISFSRGDFFLGVEVIQRNNNFKWDLIVVYGPADHSRSGHFLREIFAKIANSPNPVAIGGDFNLIRSADDKSNRVINDLGLVDIFNEWVADLALIELHRVGARFTWTNNREDPIRCVLDRVFSSTEWETKFPSCSLTAETCLGSDHCPLVLQSGESYRRIPKRFFFEKQWIL